MKKAEPKIRTVDVAQLPDVQPKTDPIYNYAQRDDLMPIQTVLDNLEGLADTVVKFYKSAHNSTAVYEYRAQYEIINLVISWMSENMTYTLRNIENHTREVNTK